MIIYSITVSVDQAVAPQWFRWMQNVHIPDVMQTGYFKGFDMHQLLDPPPQEGTLTYNIQYTCKSMDAYLAYQASDAPRLQEAHTKAFKDRFVAFRTLLKRL